jgi:hypothetical protein
MQPCRRLRRTTLAGRPSWSGYGQRSPTGASRPSTRRSR